jgi:zinc/manganese transport system ATP-binding protein
MDLAGARAILGLIRGLHQAGITIVVVTHQLNDVVNSALRIGLVSDGGLSVGTTAEMITEERLTTLYGVPVEVIEAGSRRVVLTAEPGSEGRSSEPDQ